MIIWSGLGIVAPLIVVLCTLLPVPLGAALLVSAFLVAGLGYYLNNKRVKVYIDVHTGENVLRRGGHSLFFVPLQYWAFILAIIGISLLLR